MRVPLDYDDLPMATIHRDLHELSEIHRFAEAEIYETSPGHHTAVIPMSTNLDKAITIILQSRCDSDYKEWVLKHKDLTERITRKNKEGEFPKQVAVWFR